MKEAFLCFGAVFVCSRLAVSADTFTVSCAESVITGKYGSSVVFPCWLSPKTPAEHLEIRWFRPDQFTTPLLFYQNRKIITDLQETYRNRSSLTSGFRSAGLKEGDVSLRLDNLSLSDIGIFYCYVSGDKSYDTKTVTLNLTALGSPLLISLERHYSSVNLSSMSCGWFPQPNLLWESTSALSDLGSTSYSKQADGLFCIYSRVLLPPDSNTVSCSVSLSEQEERSVSVYFGDDLLRGNKHTGFTEVDYCSAWKSLFAVMLLCVLALLLIGLVLHRKYKDYKVVEKPDECQMSDEQPQQSEGARRVVDRPANMRDLRQAAVTITLDTEKCKKDYLRFNGPADTMRDTEAAASKYKGHGFPYDLCVHGRETFSAGRVYWEVGLKQPNVPPKMSWLVGIAKASYTPSEKKSDLTPSNGFWFLCSDPENGLHANTEPEICLNKTVECVGVLLDFDKSELSFYSATEGLHLVTMRTRVQEDVVPLFNPGLGDTAPLQIINLKVAIHTELEGSADSSESAFLSASSIPGPAILS